MVWIKNIDFQYKKLIIFTFVEMESTPMTAISITVHRKHNMYHF